MMGPLPVSKKVFFEKSLQTGHFYRRKNRERERASVTCGTEFQSLSTHLAIVVQVRVKPDGVVPRRLQVNQWRRHWVVLWEIHVKLKTAVGVRGVSRTRNKHL